MMIIEPEYEPVQTYYGTLPTTTEMVPWWLLILIGAIAIIMVVKK